MATTTTHGHYLYARHARRAGEHVSAFRLETLDGRQLAMLLWGQLQADGTDTRGAELIGAEPVGRCPLSIGIALWLRNEVGLLELAEVPKAIRARAAAQRREAYEALRQRRATAR